MAALEACEALIEDSDRVHKRNLYLEERMKEFAALQKELWFLRRASSVRQPPAIMLYGMSQRQKEAWSKKT